MSFLNWCLSSTVREARQMCSHARKLIASQRDLLKPEAVAAVQASVDSLDRSTRESVAKPAIQEQMKQLEATAVKWLKPYPNASYRENVEVLLVAIAVAMGIRTFFLQPFKIPTGSMQPTLYGVTASNHQGQSDFVIPNALVQAFEFVVSGVTYHHVVAKNSGVFSVIDYQPSRFLLFNLRQRFKIGEEVYTIWSPPENLWRHANLMDGMSFRAGEDVIKMRAVSGDHLFVDRMTYNFRRPSLGDIVVFRTAGIRYQGMTDDQHYIKRLIGVGGDTVQIGNDRHVVLNGKRLDASTPHFSKVYDDAHWQPDGYMGHANGLPMMTYFGDDKFKYQVPKNNYLVMGDNTYNSSDSRYWGTYPRENVIGKSFFVYWPFNQRFGWWGHD